MTQSIGTIKEFNSFKYFTGAHPEIRKHFRQGNRPSEFGNKVWATSHVLLNYLDQEPFDLRGLRVLEIGCGWGLLGVYLAKKYKCNVTCSDLDKCVLPIVEMHAQLNNVNVQTRQSSFAGLTKEYLKNFDLIIGSEVCYSEEVAKEILELMERAFKAKVSRVLIGDPGRPDFSDCYRVCKEKYNSKITVLPGSVNGKTTQLLTVQKH
jgi:predicted nicotinamide N-methyase